MITYDYSLSSADACGRAPSVSDEALSAAGPRLEKAVGWLRSLMHEESFVSTPEADSIAVRALANVLKRENENGLVIGIGGSSLGARSVYDALVRPLSGTWRDGSERDGLDLLFCENVDPVEVSDYLDCLPLDETVVAVITKSGATIESMSTFLVVRDLLLRSDPNLYQAQVIAITDPEHGALRPLADDDGLQSLAIPQGVGGRFSVFTPAGLFPLALAGVDVEAFLRGAARGRDAALRQNLAENPAAAFAATQVLLYEAGATDVVFMPYSAGMAGIADWFVQLWAESLGKTERVGPTPIRAVGVTDQHSQMQLFMEGPPTKNVVFIEVAEEPVDVKVPKVPVSCGTLDHLSGSSLSRIRAAELDGVRAALRGAGRPSSTFTLPRVDAEHLGELMMTLACATAIAGRLFDVDPFDQPGVEHAKRVAHGVLGRADEATFAEEAHASRSVGGGRFMARSK